MLALDTQADRNRIIIHFGPSISVSTGSSEYLILYTKLLYQFINYVPVRKTSKGKEVRRDSTFRSEIGPFTAEASVSAMQTH